VRQETLAYNADGIAMRSQLFVEPAPFRRAGVLVFPEAFGLGEHVIERARMLAALGFVALACDLHGDGKYVDDLQEAMDLLQPLFADPARTRARGLGALRALAARPEVDADRMAAIGFCFPMPLELARSGADVKAVVGFHTALLTKAPASEASAIQARVLVCVGADDPMITPAHRTQFESEMRDAGVDWEMQVYGGTVHSFTNQNAAKRNMPNAIRYNPEADARSWAAMLDLFGATLAAADAETGAFHTPAFL
jgi:dienelactone hydrolase